MITDYQVIVDTVCSMFLIAFPFALIFSLVAKVTNFFMSFVFGSKEVKL